jgi:dihydroflavonol-4-reductase
MPTALVLGATGFIGGHVALAALERGWRVRGLRRDPHSTGHIGGAPVEWLTGDIDRGEGLREALAGAEVVFHAAAYYPRVSGHVSRQVAVAVAQTRRLLEAASDAGVGRLVYTSTLSTIGLPPAGEARLADERDRYLPGSIARSAYYECKYAMESEVLRAAAGGLPAVVVNPTVVFGPGDLHPTTGGVILAVARGLVPAWVPATLNVVDVRDAAAAEVRAAEVGRTGERTILGGSNVTVSALIEAVAEITGVRPPRVQISLTVAEALAGLGDVIPALAAAGNHLRAIRYWQGYDCRKARLVLGLEPRPLATTLRDALAWYQARGILTRGRSVV